MIQLGREWGTFRAGRETCGAITLIQSTSSCRRRLRLSVRALMVLVLITGGGLGWLVYSARIQRDAIAAIQRGRIDLLRLGNAGDQHT